MTIKSCTARGFWDGPNWYEDTNLRRYFIIDINRNIVTDTYVDLEALGRELEVLAPWEKVAK